MPAAPGRHPAEATLFFQQRWLQAGVLTVVLVQEPEEEDFQSGPTCRAVHLSRPGSSIAETSWSLLELRVTMFLVTKKGDTFISSAAYGLGVKGNARTLSQLDST